MEQNGIRDEMNKNRIISAKAAHLTTFHEGYLLQFSLKSRKVRISEQSFAQFT